MFPTTWTPVIYESPRSDRCPGSTGLASSHPGGAGAGLIWAVNGGRVAEIHRDWAGIELAQNGSQRVFDRRRVLAGDTTLPWIEQGNLIVYT
jgi:hypothetical protein